MIEIERFKNEIRIYIDGGYIGHYNFVWRMVSFIYVSIKQNKQILEVIELFESGETIVKWVDGKIERRG